MHNSKLIHILSVLNPEELKRLYKFLKSPYYNANPHLIKLYKILRVDHPHFSSPTLSKERVFRKLFPDNAYNHAKLLNLMSDLTALVRTYLQHLQLETEAHTQEHLLLAAYASRPEAYELFVRQADKTQDHLHQLSHQSPTYHERLFRLNKLSLSHPKTDKFSLSKSQYEDSLYHLDCWYIQEKLLLSCEVKAREKPLSEHYDIWLAEQLRSKSEEYQMNHPTTRAYLDILDLLQGGEESVYYQLKQLFLSSFAQFSPIEKQNILQSLINYTIQQGNQGQRPFVRENFELYQFGLSKQLFLEQGILDDMIYLSIVNIALRVGESSWCLDFIQSHHSLLPEGKQKDAHALATALWHYRQQQTGETIQLLRQLDFKNVYYQIQARVLLIKVYVETIQQDSENIELVISLSQAFERYIRRNKTISATNRTALLNFTLIVRRLAKFRDRIGTEGQSVNKIKQELQAMGSVYNRNWLGEQLA
ncbi:MAG: hypothetical protein AAF587_10045 [Bacteroidota bacterium]